MTTASAEPPVIRLAGLSYTYPGPPPVPALRAMDLVVRRGEHVAITGPSGSGKSTLLNLVGLLDRPTEGTIEVDGLDVGAAPERRRAAVRARRIGFVFQSFHLLPHRTAVENVMLAQIVRGRPTARALQRGAGGAGPGRPGPPGRCPAHRAVRRRAAASGHRPRPGQPPVPAAVRRADRQPRQRDPGELPACLPPCTAKAPRWSSSRTTRLVAGRGAAYRSRSATAMLARRTGRAAA